MLLSWGSAESGNRLTALNPMDGMESALLAHVWLLPVAVLVATLAMASGIEGGALFTPLFLLGLGLPPQLAAAAGLVTEVFGFSSGLIGYQRLGLIDWRLVGSVLPISLPLALAGALLAGVLPAAVLESLLLLVLLALAVTFLLPPTAQDSPATPPAQHQAWGGIWLDRLLQALGALCLGAVSAGLGEMNAYVFLRRRSLPAASAVASGVAIVAISAQAAAITTVVRLLQGDSPLLEAVLPVVAFTAPGVLIGAQCGAWLGGRLPQRWLERCLGGVLLLLAGALALQLQNLRAG